MKELHDVRDSFYRSGSKHDDYLFSSHHRQHHVSHGKKVMEPIVTIVVFYGTCYLIGLLIYGN